MKDIATFTALSCPQCAAPLPRQASWRMVTCPYCNATVTRSTSVVEAARFHEAYARVNAHAFLNHASCRKIVKWRGQAYCLLARLGTGEHADVHLAERISPLPQRVTLKLAHAGAKAGALAAEAGILDALQSIEGEGAAYFSTRLPQAVGVGTSDDAPGYERELLVLRHPTGFWGSLADVMHSTPAGIDPRHAVWIWRRILEVLAFVHANGWTHGDLSPEHLLVHPRDHGVLIIGWGRALRGHDAKRIARDLMQSAWTIRALLRGGNDLPSIPATTPEPLAELLRRASEDADWCARTGAQDLDQAVLAAARQAYGKPRFIPFTPTAAFRH